MTQLRRRDEVPCISCTCIMHHASCIAKIIVPKIVHGLCTRVFLCSFWSLEQQPFVVLLCDLVE